MVVFADCLNRVLLEFEEISESSLTERFRDVRIQVVVLPEGLPRRVTHSGKVKHLEVGPLRSDELFGKVIL